jgi:hypothetical protein
MPDDSSNHCSGRQVPADQFQDPFVPDPGGQPAHQPVVVDSVEKLGQIHVNHVGVPVKQIAFGL